MLDMAHQSIKEKNGNHLEFPFCRWPRGFALVSVFTKISGQILPIEFKFFFPICSIETNALRDNEACDACQKWSNFIWNITHNMNDELYDSMSKLCSDYSELPKQSFVCIDH